MKKYLLTGLVILLPIAITITIVVFIIDLLTAPFVGVVGSVLITLLGNEIQNIESYNTLLMILSRIVSLIILFFLTIFLGFLGRRFFFSYLIKKMNLIFTKIPIIKTIYKTTRDVSKVFLKDDEKLFRKSVLVPFPHDKSRVLGLVSGDVPDVIQKTSDKKLEAVFVPTSPHPISGFLTMLDVNDVKEVDLTTEELFKIVISCGAYDPKDLKDDEA